MAAATKAFSAKASASSQNNGARSAASKRSPRPTALVDDALRDGTLVLADPLQVASGARYSAYVHPASEHAAVARDFCRWLKRTLRERAQLATAA